MSVEFDFNGKVVLVTGSSSGIGADTAILFARYGARVVVTGRRVDGVWGVSEECDRVSTLGVKALPVVMDVTKEEDMKGLVDKTIETFSQIDVLVNNAGFGISGAITDLNYMNVFRSTFETNLSSVVYMTHLCAEHLSKTNANIVNTSTVGALIAVSIDVLINLMNSFKMHHAYF